MALIPEDTVTVDGILKNSPGHRTSPKNSLSVHLTLQEMMGAVGRERANQVKSIYIYIYIHFTLLESIHLVPGNQKSQFGFLHLASPTSHSWGRGASGSSISLAESLWSKSDNKAKRLTTLKLEMTI